MRTALFLLISGCLVGCTRPSPTRQAQQLAQHEIRRAGHLRPTSDRLLPGDVIRVDYTDLGFCAPLIEEVVAGDGSVLVYGNKQVRVQGLTPTEAGLAITDTLVPRMFLRGTVRVEGFHCVRPTGKKSSRR